MSDVNRAFFYGDTPDKKIIYAISAINGIQTPFYQENRAYLEQTIKDYIDITLQGFDIDVSQNYGVNLKYQNDHVSGNAADITQLAYFVNFYQGQTITDLEFNLCRYYLDPILRKYIPNMDSLKRLGAVVDYMLSDECLNKTLVAGPVLRNYLFRQAQGYNDPASEIRGILQRLSEFAASASLVITGAIIAKDAFSNLPKIDTSIGDIELTDLTGYSDLVGQIPKNITDPLTQLIKDANQPQEKTPAQVFPVKTVEKEDSNLIYILLALGALAKIIL